MARLCLMIAQFPPNRILFINSSALCNYIIPHTLVADSRLLFAASSTKCLDLPISVTITISTSHRWRLMPATSFLLQPPILDASFLERWVTSSSRQLRNTT